MTQRLLLPLVAFFGFVVAVPVARTAGTLKSGRDLASAAPESVGVSPERLHRLDAAMKKLVDDRQVDDLDQEIVLTPDTDVRFLKLVPLVGG